MSLAAACSGRFPLPSAKQYLAAGAAIGSKLAAVRAEMDRVAARRHQGDRPRWKVRSGRAAIRFEPEHGVVRFLLESY